MKKLEEKLLRRKREAEEDDEQLLNMKFKERVRNESKKLWIVAGPAICTRFSTIGINVITQAFIGHVGSVELAAYSLVYIVLLRFTDGILDHNLTIHLCLSWGLTVECQLGVAGAMVAAVLAVWLPNVGMLAYVVRGGCPETWKGLSWLGFEDLWDFVKMSLSSGVMMGLEIWYTTILVILTLNLVNAEVSIDALLICLSINGLEMMIAFGFMAATSVRVSNELGKGSSEAAKFSVFMALLTSFAIGFACFTLFLFFKNDIGYIFTDIPEVAKAVSDLSPLLALSILLNSVQPVLSGVAVGAGWQNIVAYINIVCYYLIGIPVALVLGYVIDMQVQGVWIGMLFGTFVQTIVLLIVTYKTDWEKQVIASHKRLNQWFVAETEEKDTAQNVYNFGA